MYVRGKRLQKVPHTVRVLIVALSNSEGQTAGGTRESLERGCRDLSIDASLGVFFTLSRQPRGEHKKRKRYVLGLE